MTTRLHDRSWGDAVMIGLVPVGLRDHREGQHPGSAKGVRRLLRTSLTSLGLVLGMSVAAVAQDQRPNILLIVADDMGYADMGAYGGEIETPNLDELADLGVRFTQFTASATCSPSRSMMLTGTDNHVAGLGNMAEQMAPNQVGQPGYEGELNDRVVPVSALLREAGYNTFMAGKWHMGEEPDKIPAAQGFIRDLALLPGGGSHLEDMWGATGERMPFTLNGEPLTALRPGYDSSIDYTDAIISNIEEFRNDDKPFFVYLAYQAPHDPFQPPFNWRDHYSGRYDQGYDATRADRIARMQEIGIVPKGSTVFPRIPAIPAWEDLSDEERRASARSMELYARLSFSCPTTGQRARCSPSGRLGTTATSRIGDGPEPSSSMARPGRRSAPALCGCSRVTCPKAGSAPR